MIISPEQATPMWLTSVLQEAGVLPCGEVLAIELQPTGAFNSATMRLRLTYTHTAPETAAHFDRWWID